MPARRSRRDQRAESGQIIVIFALAFVVITGMVGLVLDGSATFAQRRGQQNAADLAALAAANDYLLTGNLTSATATGRTVSGQNGYSDGVSGTSVSVNIVTTQGAVVTVDVAGVHRNSFVSVLGFPTFGVSATATAIAGFPDTAAGAAPIVFSVHAFGSDGQPLAVYSDASHPYDFGDGNGDTPNSGSDIVWSNYGTGNVDTNGVRAILNGSTVITKTIQFGTYIGQHNNGNHTDLFEDVDLYLSGRDIGVPIVDSAGNFQGWSTFHVVSASGGSSKSIKGYFKNKFQALNLSVGLCDFGNCPRYLGSYVLKLVN